MNFDLLKVHLNRLLVSISGFYTYVQTVYLIFSIKYNLSELRSPFLETENRKVKSILLVVFA